MSVYAYPVVGRTGLGNMLITWARAVVFAKETGAKLIAPAWTNFGRIGPIVRREKDKRLYLGQFTNDGYVKGLSRFLRLVCLRHVDEHKYNGEQNCVVKFSGHEEGMRFVLKHLDIVKAELLRITDSTINKRLDELPQRFIGVHLRLGDFAKIGFTLDADYYKRAIRRALHVCEKNTPICVFSDARYAQISYLTEEFPNLKIMPKAPALQDILSLSRAKVLVATNRSTFSAWAAVLGNMPNYWDKNGEPPSSFLGLREFELV